MVLRLHLLRHGETTHSQTGGYCGTTDPELTDAGTDMAKAFAEAYKDEPWSAIFVSPMKRTRATAHAICEAVGIEPEIRDGLKEMDFGEWEDRSVEHVKTHYAVDYVRWLTEPAWNPPTGGETAVQVASRASLVLAEIESKYPDGHVLVVSHKSTIRIMLCGLLGIDVGRYRDRINALVASVSIVRFDEHGPRLEVLGDRHHLPEELRNRAGT
ncbi:MAG: histidine phosphatase family protein [Leptolyngbyaceae bacterium]|nr:histidine phosphatase family protein [Leptolyngbyaceae bacterium]